VRLYVMLRAMRVRRIPGRAEFAPSHSMLPMLWRRGWVAHAERCSICPVGPSRPHADTSRMARVASVFALAAALVFAGGAWAAAPAGLHAAARLLRHASPAEVVRRTPALEQQLVVAINEVRLKGGLVPLRADQELAAVASAHSLSMAERGYFQHSSATGSPFWHRIETRYQPRKRRFWSVGENLAWASPSLTAAEAVGLWLRSPLHRRNLLNPAWRDFGVSGVHAYPAPGVYGGLAATIVTVDFGVR
jgi:uncharacterized protein YkwD